MALHVFYCESRGASLKRSRIFSTATYKKYDDAAGLDKHTRSMMMLLDLTSILGLLPVILGEIEAYLAKLV